MEFSFDNFAKEGLHEECGVFGIFSDGTINPAYACYNGLLALQHRGQESCGIAVSDEGVIDYHKDMGLVTEVFNNKILDSLNGQMAVSHVRYSTAGGSVLENAQPLVMRYVKGTLSIAHNGNLTNALEIRRGLEQRGAIFQTTIDSEVICYVIARERLKCHSVEDAVARTMQVIEGAYSLLVMSPRKLIAVRDPHGFRPLCMGKYNDSYVFASESAALDACGAEFVRDVEPGEIVIVDQNGVRSMKPDFGDKKKALCIFEYIYFARMDSVIDNINVYHARIVAGKALAQSYPVEADLVVGVPDSGLVAAKGYSEYSGIPYGMAFHKNSYVGRTFIKPKQSQRESSVKIKLNVIEEVVRGKRIVMVDDSIVRGTTCANIIKMLKKAGAKEVHVRISSPPFLHPCYFGTDVPSNDQLIAHSHTTEQIREMIGADSLGYMEIDKLKDMVGDLGYCDACFTGNYPMRVPGKDISHAFESEE